MTTELIDGSIFLHVPKTGGTWAYDVLCRLGLVRRAAGRNQGGHSDFTRAVLYPRNKPRWREWTNPRNYSWKNLLSSGRHATIPYTFCFVRHPVTWYESAWRFLPTIPEAKRATWINRERYIKRMHPFGVACQCLHEDLNQFVRNVLQAFPGYVTWIYNMFAPAEVSFVGKQETLCEDLLAVLRQRGFEFDEEMVRNLPPANASPGSPAVEWEAEVLEEIQDVEAAALRRFGYQRRRQPRALALR